MERKTLEKALDVISELKPHEWEQLQHYVNKKYSSKQKAVPMPSREEYKDVTQNDIPCLKD